MALLTILGMVLLGYIRQEYLILWEAPFHFTAIRRVGEEALSAGNFTAQLPALLVFLLLFWVGNSLLISTVTRNKSWWLSLLVLYASISAVAAALILLNRKLEAPLLISSAQLLKELLLSPLPALIILPVLWWQVNSHAKEL
jgi:hypothetical protein